MFVGYPNCCTTYMISWGDGKSASEHTAKMLDAFSGKASMGRNWTQQIQAIAYVVATSRKNQRSRNVFLERFGFNRGVETDNEIFWWIDGPGLVKNAGKIADGKTV